MPTDEEKALVVATSMFFFGFFLLSLGFVPSLMLTMFYYWIMKEVIK